MNSNKIAIMESPLCDAFRVLENQIRKECDALNKKILLKNTKSTQDLKEFIKITYNLNAFFIALDNALPFFNQQNEKIEEIVVFLKNQGYITEEKIYEEETGRN